MSLSEQQQNELANFPAALRALIENEVAAGNEIVELSHGFPAAPCGAYVKLARPVSTRERRSTGELSFYDREMPSYSGEFTDAKRHFFVLEPPRPPAPPPDMNAIRERASRSSAAPVERAREPQPPSSPAPRVDWTPTRVQRFAASMVIDVDKWRDGVGYDLDLLREATGDERVDIETLLVCRGVQDWRDVEALAALDTVRARQVLEQTLREGGELAVAVTRFAPHLSSEGQRTAALVAALEKSEFYGGLTEALSEAEDFHPPEVVDALWRGVLERPGEIAVHFVALLMWIHGQAESPFDWELRPYFLTFHTEDRAERERLVRELRERLSGSAPG